MLASIRPAASLSCPLSRLTKSSVSLLNRLNGGKRARGENAARLGQPPGADRDRRRVAAGEQILGVEILAPLFELRVTGEHGEFRALRRTSRSKTILPCVSENPKLNPSPSS